MTDWGWDAGGASTCNTSFKDACLVFHRTLGDPDSFHFCCSLGSLPVTFPAPLALLRQPMAQPDETGKPSSSGSTWKNMSYVKERPITKAKESHCCHCSDTDCTALMWAAFVQCSAQHPGAVAMDTAAHNNTDQTMGGGFTIKPYFIWKQQIGV